MPRIVMIHGFATGIGYSIFRPAHGADAGFSGFHSDVESGNAKAFRWDIKEHASFFQSINPFYSWEVYRREKEMASDPDTYRLLDGFLSHEQPETIVCHSMGCFLMTGYLQQGRLPESVRHIVFNQADLSSESMVLPEEIDRRLRSGALRITNTFCFWDPTLWCSMLIGSSLKAGLVGLGHPLVENRLVPLFRPLNLHMSAIRSRGFRDFVAHGSL